MQEAASFGIPPPWRVTLPEFVQQTLFAFRWALIIWIGVIAYLYLNWKNEEKEEAEELACHHQECRRDSHSGSSNKNNKPRFVAAIVLSLTMLLTSETIQLSSDSSLLQPSSYKRAYHKMEYEFVSRVWPNYGPPDMEVKFNDEVEHKIADPGESPDIISLDEKLLTDEDRSLLERIRDNLVSLGMSEKDMIRLVQLYNIIKDRGACPPDKLLFEENERPGETFKKAEEVLHKVALQVGWSGSDLHHVRALLNMMDRVKANERIESALSSVPPDIIDTHFLKDGSSKENSKKSSFSATSLFQSEAEGQGPTPALGNPGREQFFQSDVEVDAPIKKGDNVIMPSRRSSASQTISAATFSFLTNLWAAVSSITGVTIMFVMASAGAAYFYRDRIVRLICKDEGHIARATVDPTNKHRSKRRFGRKRVKTENEDLTFSRAYSTAEKGGLDAGTAADTTPVTVVQNVQSSVKDNTAGKGKDVEDLNGDSTSSVAFEEHEMQTREDRSLSNSSNPQSSKKGTKKKRKRKLGRNATESDQEQEPGQELAEEDQNYDQVAREQSGQGEMDNEDLTVEKDVENTQVISNEKPATNGESENENLEDGDVALHEPASAETDEHEVNGATGEKHVKHESPVSSKEEEPKQQEPAVDDTNTAGSRRTVVASPRHEAASVPQMSMSRVFTDDFWDPTSEGSTVSSQIGVLPISAPHVSTNLAIEQAISSLTEFESPQSSRRPFLPSEDDRGENTSSNNGNNRVGETGSLYHDDGFYGSYGASLGGFMPHALGLNLDLGLGPMNSGHPLRGEGSDDEESERY